MVGRNGVQQKRFDPPGHLGLRASRFAEAIAGSLSAGPRVDRVFDVDWLFFWNVLFHSSTGWLFAIIF